MNGNVGTLRQCMELAFPRHVEAWDQMPKFQAVLNICVLLPRPQALAGSVF